MAQVKAKLEAKGKSSEGVETFKAFYELIKQEASKLQQAYQPQLRNGIKIAVDLVNLEYFDIEMNNIKEIDPQFLLNLRKPCEIYLGSDRLKEGLDVNIPKHAEVIF